MTNLPDDHLYKYDFTLVLNSSSPLTSEQLDAVVEAGCDDSSVGFQDGFVRMSFIRAASSLDSAISSVVAQFGKANLGIDVIKVEYAGRT